MSAYDSWSARNQSLATAPFTWCHNMMPYCCQHRRSPIFLSTRGSTALQRFHGSSQAGTRSIPLDAGWSHIRASIFWICRCLHHAIQSHQTPEAKIQDTRFYKTINTNRCNSWCKLMMQTHDANSWCNCNPQQKRALRHCSISAIFSYPRPPVDLSGVPRALQLVQGAVATGGCMAKRHSFDPRSWSERVISLYALPHQKPPWNGWSWLHKELEV